MYIALSQFAVANAREAEVAEAFRNRPHLVEQAPGFVRMEVWNPLDDPAHFLLVTWWRDAASFESWHRSHAYKASHRELPAGLRLVPAATRVDRYQRLCE